MDHAQELAPLGVLRASINLGNPVLAQGTAERPSGVTVDLARDLADRLGVPVEFRCFDAARDSFDAVPSGRADVGFLAVDPDRAGEVVFSPPYALIEGVYAVPAGSAVRTASDVDAPGMHVGVKTGSAYDLFLSRSLQEAAVERGRDGVAVAEERGLEVAAGIRAPVAAWAAQRGWRVVEPAFMTIRQAVAIPADRSAPAAAAVADWIEARKRDGSIGRWLSASGRRDAVVAEPV